MSVDRLSHGALNKILGGEVVQDATCVIKFYSNTCELCHNLKDYFEDISAKEDFSDVHFFAFNVNDYQKIEKMLNFNGVPTISVVKAKPGSKKPKIRIMPDPDPPNEKTWYYANDINNFIERER